MGALSVSGVEIPDLGPARVRSRVRSRALAVRSERGTCPESSHEPTPDTTPTHRVCVSGVPVWESEGCYLCGEPGADMDLYVSGMPERVCPDCAAAVDDDGAQA